MTKALHIVCFDAPAPPDYGGAIEMYYKIKALAEAGIVITLHYFDYKKGRDVNALKPYCQQIFSYRRQQFLTAPTFSKPHIVLSRVNRQLLKRLQQDADPVLLEGIHCTGLLQYLENSARKLVVRLHNDEALYYKNLAATEPNFFKRTYYSTESRLLHRYQKKLSPNVAYAALSHPDRQRFEEIYGLKQVVFIPAFVPWPQVSSNVGSGTYALYHGNLKVAENAAAALWLIETVFSKIEMPLYIAGKSIAHKLVKAAAPYQNIRFVSNPSDAVLATLIEQAQVHVLPDFNNTGVKLKLLHALFKGRFCITNNGAFESNTVLRAQSAADYIRILKSLEGAPFAETALAERKNLLLPYNNAKNAEALIKLLW